jgi:hypothetical protein
MSRLAQVVEGVLVSGFTRRFDGAHDSRKIVIRAEIIALDDCGILVGTGQVDGTFAVGCTSWCDCEHVRGRSAKARGDYGRHHWQLMKHSAVCVTEGGDKCLCLDGIAVGRPIGILPLLNTTGQENMVLKIRQRQQVLDDVDSKAAKRLASPTPESIRSFGLLMAPAAGIALSAAMSPRRRLSSGTPRNECPGSSVSRHRC